MKWFSPVNPFSTSSTDYTNEYFRKTLIVIVTAFPLVADAIASWYKQSHVCNNHFFSCGLPGYSDPYCMLGILLGQSPRETEEKKERKFSFRKRREKLEKRSSTKEVLPARCIQVTEVKPETLNPVWDEHFLLWVKRFNLFSECWTFDLFHTSSQMTSAAHCHLLGKSSKGLRCLMCLLV